MDSKWHYQVMRYPAWDEDDEGTGTVGYGIHEWYDQSLGPYWTHDPVPVVAESVDELRAILQDMLRDLEVYGIEDYDVNE